MFILLVVFSDSMATMETVEGLTTATLARGHEITVFFNAESVRLLEAERDVGRIASLASRGVRLLTCRTSTQEFGITSPDNLVEDAEFSSLGELVELMEDCDRTLFIG